MSAKNQYIIFFSFLILCLGVLLYFVFEEKLYFLISEFVLILIALVAFMIYRNIFRPLQFIQQGTEALLDEDFNIRISTKGHSKDINSLVDVYNKMLDKIRTERVYQQEQHYFLQSIMELIPVGIIILDYDEKITQFNSKAEGLLSLSKATIGKPLSETNSMQKALLNLEIGTDETIRNGSIENFRCACRSFVHRGFTRKYYIVEDITKEVLATEKNAFGKVIRMMSHEVNNSTGAINSMLHSLLSGEKIDPKEIREFLPIVIERNEHLGQFMSNFASVIRLPSPAIKTFNLSESIRNMTRLLSSYANERNTSFDFSELEDSFLIHADQQQLEQVLMNIFKNSIEAIESEGRIQIKLSSKTGKLQIIDNGIGILEEHQEKLFSPFFSTKQTGQGVGLTLIKQILYNHQLPFHLSSEGGLTTFEIDLSGRR